VVDRFESTSIFCDEHHMSEKDNPHSMPGCHMAAAALYSSHLSYGG
jgi:hypothetical protein